MVLKILDPIVSKRGNVLDQSKYLLLLKYNVNLRDHTSCLELTNHKVVLMIAPDF